MHLAEFQVYMLYSKNVQNHRKFYCWKYGQNSGVIRCRQVKNYYIARKGVVRKANIWQTEIQQDFNPSGSRQIEDVWWSSGLEQDWKAQGYQSKRWSHCKEDVSALIQHFQQKDLIRFISHRCRCQYIYPETSFQWLIWAQSLQTCQKA